MLSRPFLSCSPSRIKRRNYAWCTRIKHRNYAWCTWIKRRNYAWCTRIKHRNYAWCTRIKCHNYAWCTGKVNLANNKVANNKELPGLTITINLTLTLIVIVQNVIVRQVYWSWCAADRWHINFERKLVYHGSFPRQFSSTLKLFRADCHQTI